MKHCHPKLRRANFCVLAFGLLLANVLAASAQPAPTDFFFRDGDRAQILGDSITQQRMYSTLIESYVLSRFPGWKITFRNTGWSGDTMGLRTRKNLETGFNRDILPLQPTAITIDFGMNDARGGVNALKDYAANARTLVDKLKAAGVRVALITPSSEEKYEDGQPAGSAYNTLLRQYSDALKEVAVEKGVLFVDQLNPMIATIEAGRAAGVLSPNAGGVRLIPDAVHPNWGGHLVMATHILKGLNAPALVSRVELDAGNGWTNANGARVENIQTGEVISFSRTDNALPWPIPSDAAAALKIPGFTPLNDLSRYELKVAGLTAPKYEIAIDDKTIGTWTRDQLATGVNLSDVTSGPIYDQTQQLLKKIMEKNNVFYTRWRDVQLYDPPTWLKADVETSRAAELKRLDDQIAAQEAEINTLRQPRPHVWTLKPVA